MVQPTARFSNRVENYVRYRPGYPPELIRLLRSDCDLVPGSTVADIGSGTGILSKILLENGNPVIGVEPNDAMRAAAEKSLSAFPRFRSVAATAESTTLASQSVDMITAAQAAHWFKYAEARKEFLRILRPGGWVALIWNERRTDSTPFLREYEQLLLTYGVDYNDVRHENATDNIAEFFQGSAYHETVFEYMQRFDYEGVQGRLLSSSYSPTVEDSRHQPMLAELQRIFDAQHSSGDVIFEYNTRVFYGHLDELN